MVLPQLLNAFHCNPSTALHGIEVDLAVDFAPRQTGEKSTTATPAANTMTVRLVVIGEYYLDNTTCRPLS